MHSPKHRQSTHPSPFECVLLRAIVRPRLVSKHHGAKERPPRRCGGGAAAGRCLAVLGDSSGTKARSRDCSVGSTTRVRSGMAMLTPAEVAAFARFSSLLCR